MRGCPTANIKRKDKTMKENKNEKVNEYERAPGFRPRLALYHANPRGTGCAIKM